MKNDIENNPDDVSLYIELLKTFSEAKKFDDGLKMIVDVKTFGFYETPDWYERVVRFLEEYAKENADIVDDNWYYWMASVMAKERRLWKCFHHPICQQTMQTLFEFDNMAMKLEKSAMLLSDVHTLEWAAEMVTHFRASLCFFYGLLFMKRYEMIQLAWPLFCLSYSFGGIRKIEQPSWIQDASGKFLNYIQEQSNQRIACIKTLSIELSKETFSVSEIIAKYIADPEWRAKAYYETFRDGEHITDSNFVQNKIFEVPIEWQAIDPFLVMIKPMNDVELAISVADAYLKEDNIQSAFNYISLIETQLNTQYFDSEEWYAAVVKVLQQYKQRNPATVNENWLYHFQALNSLDRRLSFSPKIDLLFEFDQHLFTASKCTFPEHERELASEFLSYFQGQFHLHAGSILLNREAEQPHETKWTDASKKALPLLWMACSIGCIDSKTIPNSAERKKFFFEFYERESNKRIFQAAETFQTCENAINECMEVIQPANWKELVYYALFNSDPYLDGIASSYLAVQANIASTIDTHHTTQESPEKPVERAVENCEPQIEYASEGEINQNIEVICESNLKRKASKKTKSQQNQKSSSKDDSKHEPICSVCGKKYSNKSNLAAHIENAHNGKRYLCSQCPDTFTAAASFRRHALQIHPGLDVTSQQVSYADEGGLILTTDNADQKIRKLEAQYAHNEAKINTLKEKIN